MKKTLLACAISLIFPLFGEDNFRMSAQFFTGYLDGIMNEYVYINSSSKKISQLDWEMTDFFYSGAKAQFEYKKLSFDIGAAGFFPKNSGTMEDSDWMGIANNTGFSGKTNLSISDNTLSKGFFIFTNAGYTFNIKNFFNIFLSAGLKYSLFKFEADHNYFWYADDSNYWYTADVTYNPEKSITLQRNDFSVILRLQPVFIIPIAKNSLKISPFYQTAPYSHLKDMDNHLYRSLYFLDEASVFFYSNTTGLDISYTLSKFTFSAEYNYHFLPEFSCKSYVNSKSFESALAKSSSKGGFAESWHNFQIGIEYRFF